MYVYNLQVESNNIVIIQKSIIKIKQMNPQRQFCRLATIKGNRIALSSQGIDRLSQYDFLSIVTLEGNLHLMPPLINSSNGYEISNNQDSVWMSKYPYFSSRLKKYLIILRVAVNDQRSATLAHAFCCLLSNIVLVANPQNSNLQYLAEPLKMIQQQKNPLTSKVGALIGLSENGINISPNQNLQFFQRALSSQGLQKQQLSSLYPYISGFQFPQTYSFDNISHVIPFLQQILEQGVGNTQILTHGQIIIQYISNLSNQYNSSSVFNPTNAEDNIEIDENFQAYMGSVDRYNLKCKNALGNQPQTNIQNKLQQIRAETEQQQLFQKNPYYAKKIQTHMDRKQNQLTRLNEQLNDSYNINLLQKQSGKSLQTVTNNKNIAQEDIAKEIDRIVKKYNQKSRGANSQKLLTQFMQVFVPTIYSQAGISQQTDKRIKKLANQNKALQDEVRKLEKKQSSKCCAIM